MDSLGNKTKKEKSPDFQSAGKILKYFTNKCHMGIAMKYCYRHFYLKMNCAFARRVIA